MTAVTIRDLTDGHAAQLRAAFDDISPMLEGRIVRTAELMALASAMRGKIVASGEGDLAALTKVEELASGALEELNVPPAPEARFGGIIDVTKLNDEELDVLEQLWLKAGILPPDDDPNVVTINRLLEVNRQITLEIEEAHRLRGIAEQATQTYQRLADNGLDQCTALRTRVGELEALLATHPPSSQTNAPASTPNTPTGHPTDRPSNVVDIRGDGSCAISVPLDQRYPSGLPPVGRW